MPDGNRILSQNIKYARTKAGYTQQQSADLIGITPLHYGRLERGDRRASLDQIEKIALIFGVSPYELLDGCFDPATIPAFHSSNDEVFFGQLNTMLRHCSPEEKEPALISARESQGEKNHHKNKTPDPSDRESLN